MTTPMRTSPMLRIVLNGEVGYSISRFWLLGTQVVFSTDVPAKSSSSSSSPRILHAFISLRFFVRYYSVFACLKSSLAQQRL